MNAKNPKLKEAARELELMRLKKKLEECIEDNRRKTYAVVNLQVALESFKDRVRELELAIGKAKAVGEVFIGGLTVER